MKRTFAAALAAASVGSTMLIATPAFASNPTLIVQPDVVHNGDSLAITATCPNAANFVRLTWFGQTANGEPGKPLKVEQEIGWGFIPGEYVVVRQCIRPNGKVGTTARHTLMVLFRAAPKPPPPPKPIPGFKPNVIIKTGLGGMARSVGTHHPAR